MSRIRELRQAREWTQLDLALEAGVRPRVVSLLESDRRIPQVPQVRNQGEFFGICTDGIDLVATRHGGRHYRATRTNP